MVKLMGRTWGVLCIGLAVGLVVVFAGCSEQAPTASAPSPASPPPPQCLQESLAPFPWPDVPRPTAQRLLVRELFQPPPATLGALLAQLRQQVASAGYPPPGVLGAGCNGYALVLESERIRPDGSRLSFEQWGQSSGFSVAEILRQLVTAAPGMYRMIVVVVSSERARSTAETFSARDLEALAEQGASQLPAALAALPLDDAYEVRALVYEFLKDDSTAAQVAPNGRVPVVAHLVQAGLLPREPR